jgi:hypothetical protein
VESELSGWSLPSYQSAIIGFKHILFYSRIKMEKAYSKNGLMNVDWAGQ